jgi:threonine dehydratase
MWRLPVPAQRHILHDHTPSRMQPPTLPEIRAARDRIAGVAFRTPVVRLAIDSPSEIWLKLETLQPTSSFKVRGAFSAMSTASPHELGQGVYTASAGNMAQAVAWSASRLGVPCRVIVPEHAPDAKVAAVERLGGVVRRVPFTEWWRMMLEHGDPSESGVFVHPVCNAAVIAGNGTIGLEIAEDVPDADIVLVPFGGGGLSCGIAAALRALGSRARVMAAEVETAAPLAASLSAGEPAAIDYKPSFVDGIGASGILPEMWPMARDLLAGSVVSSVDEVADAVRLLCERSRVVAEGAGAAAVAAALRIDEQPRKIVCVVSGGNINLDRLAEILLRKRQ